MSDFNPQEDYYDVLGVSPDADAEEIKRAYRQQARQHHPDSGHGDVDRFREVQRAYEVLRDLVLRRAYDRQREKRGLSDTAPISLDLLQSRKYMQPLDGEQMLYVLLEIRPQSLTPVTNQNLNIALVIDRSTSMRGARMQNVKMAAADLLASLKPRDRLALITFSDRAEVLAPSDFAQNTRAFKSAIASMVPGGGTEIYQGLLAGLNEVQRYASNDYINHVILLTDGRTYGDEEQALTAARSASANGISISAFGIGVDWNDVFLDDLARYGEGISHYIKSPSEVRTVLKQQIQGLSNTVVQRMKLSVNTVPYVKLQNAYRAAPHMEELDCRGDNVISLGHLFVKEPVAVVLELLVNQQATGDRRIVRLGLEADEVTSQIPVRLWQDVNVSVSLEPVEEQVPPKLLNYVTRLSVFQLQERAWRALSAGDSVQASHYLESAATRLFDLEHRELGQAAMLEVGRIAHGNDPTQEGRKKLRYGTRALTFPA